MKLLDDVALEIVNAALSKGSVVEIKVESGKIVIVELGKRKILYKASHK